MQRMWSTYLDASSMPNSRSRTISPSPSTMDPSPPSTRRNSLASQATSHRPMLSDSNISVDPSSSHHGEATSTTNLFSSSQSLGNTSSLTVNYVPSKFPSTLLNPGSARRRKNTTAGFGAFAKKPGAGSGGFGIPKPGGGADAFKNGELRIPANGDEDYYGYFDRYYDINSPGANSEMGNAKAKKLKWNKFKWILFVSNLFFTIYTLTGLVICLLTWFNIFPHADVVRVGNQSELVLCTLTAAVGLFTSLIGWSGILLNNRSFLAVYAFLTWLTFALLVTPGYVSYKKRTFNLEGKINAQWSREIDSAGRLRIQNELQCCGYYSPFYEATVSATCYSRSNLPGCKSSYLSFERTVLKKFYESVFGIVPLQLAVMIVALLCSNHVTYRFGKGMMPKAYRLDLASVAAIMDQYASRLAEQYGQDFASEVMARSRTNLLQYDAMRSTASVPYSAPTASSRASLNAVKYTNTPMYQRHAKYDSLGSGITTTAPTGQREAEEKQKERENQIGQRARPSGWF